MPPIIRSLFLPTTMEPSRGGEAYVEMVNRGAMTAVRLMELIKGGWVQYEPCMNMVLYGSDASPMFSAWIAENDRQRRIARGGKDY